LQYHEQALEIRDRHMRFSRRNSLKTAGAAPYASASPKFSGSDTLSLNE
jgi:hypothetical protein